MSKPKIFNMFIYFILILILITINSCGGSKKESSIPTSLKTTTIFVSDISSRKPIASAIITLSLDKNKNGIIEQNEISSFVTDDSGSVTLTYNTDVKKILKVEANGYVPVIRNLPAGAVLPDTILLEPLESEENVKIEQTEEGVTITSSQVEVDISNVGKNRRALRAFSRVNSVEVGYINPGRNPENMPGDFKGYFNGSVILNSAGAFTIQFFDENGWPVELPEGNYTVKIKVSPENYAGLEDYNLSTEEVEIPLWYFDEKEGLWKRNDEMGYLVDENGTKITRERLARITAGEENATLYVVGSVRHFSFINCDIPTRPAGITGKLKGIDCKDKDLYIEVIGVNWNGGQGGNKVNPDCTFSVPTPYKDDFKKPEKKTKCPEVTKEMLINFLDKMNTLSVDINLSEPCRRQWKKVSDYLEQSAYRIQDYFYDLANDPTLNIPESTREALKTMGDKFGQYIAGGEYNKALELVDKLYNVYVKGEDISAEKFMETERKLREKLWKDTTQLLLGITMGDSSIKEFFKDLGEVASSGVHPCLKPFVSAGVEKIGSKIDEFINNQGKVSWDTTQEVIGFIGDVVSKTIDEKTGQFSGDFIACIEKIPSLSKYAPKLASMSATAAKRLNAITIEAQILAAEIQAAFDIYDAQQEINQSALASIINEGLNLIPRAIRSSLDMVDPECIPENYLYKDFILFNYGEYDADECQFSNYLGSLVMQNFSKRTSRSLRSNRDETTGWLAFKKIVEVLNALKDQDNILRTIAGDKGTYTRWFDANTGKEITTLPAGISGNPQKLGGYLSKLVLTSRSLGIYRVPINKITSTGINTNLIPSPGVPAYFGNKIITAWIGEIDVSDILSTKNAILTLNINAPEGITLQKIKRIEFTFANRKVISITPECNYQNNKAVCSFSLYSSFFGENADASVSLVVSNGKTFRMLYYTFPVTISEDMTKDLTVYFCQQPSITSITVPDVVKPEGQYNASAEVIWKTFPSSESCENAVTSYEWFFGRIKLPSNSTEVSFTTPDKITMARLGKNIYLGFRVCSGRECDSRGKWIKVEVSNTSPEITEIDVPENISSTQTKVNIKVTAQDKDEDKLYYRWYALPSGLLNIEKGVDQAEAVLSVSHIDRDVEGRVCVAVSDGLAEVSSCKKVLIKKYSHPPKILGITFFGEKLATPVDLQFSVDYTADNPLKKVHVTLNGPENATYSFSNPAFTLHFDTPGTYQLVFKVEDEEGLTSQPYYYSLVLYNSTSLSLSFTGEISSFNAENGTAELSLALSVVTDNQTFIKDYLWDLDGDGDYEYITSEPALTVELPQEELAKINKIHVKVETLYDFKETTLSLENLNPYVSLSADVKEGEPPLTVNFNATAYFPNATVDSYSFDFDGDGNPEVETSYPTATYTYNSSGTYYPKVVATFSNGKTAEASIKIKVISKGYIETFSFSDFGWTSGSANEPLIDSVFNGSITMETLYYNSNQTGKWQFLFLEHDSELQGIKDVAKLYPFYSIIGHYLTRISDGYILNIHGSFCENATCENYESGDCVFRLDDNKQILWHKCFESLDLRKGIVEGNKIYFINDNYGGYTGVPALVVLDLETGDLIASKRITYNGTGLSSPRLYVDSGGIYIVGGLVGRVLLFKLDLDLNLVYAKELSYQNYTYYSPRFIRGDDRYLYIIVDVTVSLAQHAQDLWKIDKTTGDLVFVKRVLYECPWYCYYINDVLLTEDSIYLLGSYYFQGGDGQRVIKLDKEGNLIWASKIKLCNQTECSDEAHSISSDKYNNIYVFGEISTVEEKPFYAVNLSATDGLIGGCEGYVEKVDADDIGYQEEPLSDVSVNDLDKSLFVMEDATPAQFDIYYELEDGSALISEQDMCSQ